MHLHASNNPIPKETTCLHPYRPEHYTQDTLMKGIYSLVSATSPHFPQSSPKLPANHALLSPPSTITHQHKPPPADAHQRSKRNGRKRGQKIERRGVVHLIHISPHPSTRRVLNSRFEPRPTPQKEERWVSSRDTLDKYQVDGSPFFPAGWAAGRASDTEGAYARARARVQNQGGGGGKKERRNYSGSRETKGGDIWFTPHKRTLPRHT